MQTVLALDVAKIKTVKHIHKHTLNNVFNTPPPPPHTPQTSFYGGYWGLHRDHTVRLPVCLSFRSYFSKVAVYMDEDNPS